MCRLLFFFVRTSLLFLCSTTLIILSGQNQSPSQNVSQNLNGKFNCIPQQGKPLPDSFVLPDYTLGNALLLSLIDTLTLNPHPHPDIFKTAPQLVKDAGYPLECHEVTGENGYILTVFRIPHGKNTPATKGSVIVHHGLLTHWACWIATVIRDSFRKNLTFVLADEGYDVWLPNARGTVLSQKHVSLPAGSPEYWDFSWEDMGRYDLPAIIDFILKKTGDEQLFYIGHSMGTTIFFAGMALRPEYCAKIKLMIALAPVGYYYHSTSVLRVLGLVEAVYAVNPPVFNTANPGQVMPNELVDILGIVLGSFCLPGVIVWMICSLPFFLMGGFDYLGTNMTQLPIFLAHSQNPSSFNCIRHYAQSMHKDRFAQFDFGPEKNMEIYRQCEPPEFNIAAISCPVAFFHSQNDAFAQPKDVKKLADKFPNPVLDYFIPDPHFNHFDYLCGLKVQKLVIEHVVELLERYKII